VFLHLDFDEKLGKTSGEKQEEMGEAHDWSQGRVNHVSLGGRCTMLARVHSLQTSLR
jgi:hypothetical protein